MLPEESLIRMQLPAAQFPAVAIFDPHRCRTTWNSARRSVCTEVIFQDIPHLTAACGCLKILRPSSLSESTLELQSWLLAARAIWLASGRPFQYPPTAN